ncbi:hypothetical protein S2E19_03989 [Bacillus mycoides]|nr:hypothetical protein S2E19_03989 [Bacillus mycoides]
MGTGIEMHSKAQLVGNVVVAPLVGAGIEILSSFGNVLLLQVAPLVGAWIEISIWLY